MSTPITSPPPPTLRAARRQSRPAPEPRSTTTSPGASCASDTGLPQPSTRSVPVSSPNSISAALYPMSARDFADGVATQHASEPRAVAAYASRTASRVVSPAATRVSPSFARSGVAAAGAVMGAGRFRRRCFFCIESSA